MKPRHLSEIPSDILNECTIDCEDRKLCSEFAHKQRLFQEALKYILLQPFEGSASSLFRNETEVEDTIFDLYSKAMQCMQVEYRTLKSKKMSLGTIVHNGMNDIENDYSIIFGGLGPLFNQPSPMNHTQLPQQKLEQNDNSEICQNRINLNSRENSLSRLGPVNQKFNYFENSDDNVSPTRFTMLSPSYITANSELIPSHMHQTCAKSPQIASPDYSSFVIDQTRRASFECSPFSVNQADNTIEFAPLPTDHQTTLASFNNEAEKWNALQQQPLRSNNSRNRSHSRSSFYLQSGERMHYLPSSPFRPPPKVIIEEVSHQHISTTPIFTAQDFPADKIKNDKAKNTDDIATINITSNEDMTNKTKPVVNEKQNISSTLNVSVETSPVQTNDRDMSTLSVPISKRSIDSSGITGIDVRQENPSCVTSVPILSHSAVQSIVENNVDIRLSDAFDSSDSNGIKSQCVLKRKASKVHSNDSKRLHIEGNEPYETQNVDLPIGQEENQPDDSAFEVKSVVQSDLRLDVTNSSQDPENVEKSVTNISILQFLGCYILKSTVDELDYARIEELRFLANTKGLTKDQVSAFQLGMSKGELLIAASRLLNIDYKHKHNRPAVS